jgi:plasmid maintenance system antidote protein VapI
MSRGPKRNYNERKITPKIRLSKFPYLPEKIDEILAHYHMTVSALARKTHIKQSGLSRCLNGHSLISEPSVHLLSKSFPDPIPLWWLMSGPEEGSLQDALAKEKTHASAQKEAPRDTSDLIEQFRSVMSAAGDAQVVRWHNPLTELTHLAYDDVVKQRVSDARHVSVTNDTRLSSHKGRKKDAPSDAGRKAS